MLGQVQVMTILICLHRKQSISYNIRALQCSCKIMANCCLVVNKIIQKGKHTAVFYRILLMFCNYPVLCWRLHYQATGYCTEGTLKLRMVCRKNIVTYYYN